jgi:hypothetical protein
MPPGQVLARNIKNKCAMFLFDPFSSPCLTLPTGGPCDCSRQGHIAHPGPTVFAKFSSLCIPKTKKEKKIKKPSTDRHAKAMTRKKKKKKT